MKEQKIEFWFSIIVFFGGLITFIFSIYGLQELSLKQFESSKDIKIYVINNLSWVEIVSLIITLVGFFWFAFTVKIFKLINNKEFKSLPEGIEDKVFKSLLNQSVNECMHRYDEIITKGKYFFTSPESSKHFILTVLQTSSNYGLKMIYSTWNITILNRTKLIDKLFDPDSDVQKAWNSFLSKSPQMGKRLIILDNSLLQNNLISDFVNKLDENNKAITKIYNIDKPGLSNHNDRDYMLCLINKNTNYILHGGLSESGDANYDGFLESVTEISQDFIAKKWRFEKDFEKAAFINECFKNEKTN